MTESSAVVPAVVDLAAGAEVHIQAGCRVAGFESATDASVAFCCRYSDFARMRSGLGVGK